MSKKANPSIYSLEANDPNSFLIARAHLSKEDTAQIGSLMAAMGKLREIERKASEASQRFMKLNETDMRALHYLVVAEYRSEEVSPSALARQLNITSASVTKMLDRLEAAGHIRRHDHPTDRRALTITITPETRAAAIGSVGRHQASRFTAAAKLTREERDVVIKYLLDTANDLDAALHHVSE
ncbi:MAG: MarR family transcriptional regulator [Microbacteriaceae bacterium]